MSEFKAINELTVELATNPFDPVLSFNLALEYEKIGQTAAAVSFYLRTAEYGYFTHPEYVYASLLKSSGCFENQTGRQITVLNLILKAIAHAPSRPEAWMLLSRHYQITSKWQESYTASEVGLSFEEPSTQLPTFVGYPGRYGLEFQKGVAAWWVGRKDETGDLFRKLIKEPIAPIYLTAIQGNMERLNIPTEPESL